MIAAASSADALELASAFDLALNGLLSVDALLDAAAHDRPLEGELEPELLGLGWVGLAVPEELGGLGLDGSGCALLAAIAGARLLPIAMRGEALILAPLLATRSPDPRLERLIDGSLRGGGVASVEATSSAEALEVTAFLPPNAKLLGILGENCAFVVDLRRDDVRVTPIRALEAGQGAARIEVERPQTFAVAIEPDAIADISRRWRLAVMAETFGVGKEALGRAVTFAGQREQFGRPIASFQAIAHLLASAAVSLEAANAGLGRLAIQAAGDQDALDGVLTHVVPAASRTACEVAIQVHGGMGFTWELGLHLFYRRALSIQALLGGAQGSLRRAGGMYLAGQEQSSQ